MTRSAWVFARFASRGEEERDGGFGLAHAARGVDHGGELPGRLAGAELLAREAELLDQLRQTRPRREVDCGESAAYEYAVFVAKGHEIGYRPQGDELEPREIVVAEPVGLFQREGYKEVFEDVDLGEGLRSVAAYPRHFPEPDETLSAGLRDLSALGTIADLMPLRDENRILVRRGLAAINLSSRPGLAELVREARPRGQEARRRRDGLANNARDQRRGPHGRTRSRRFALPRRRSRRARDPGRSRHPDERGQKAAGRRGMGARLPQGHGQPLRARQKLALVGGEEVHRGITGLIASRLTSTLDVPAVVASFQGDGTVVGSVRSARGFAVTPFLEACADLFIDYGGHDSAAGFSLKIADWPEFLTRVRAYAEVMELLESEETIEVDAELPHEFLKPELTSLTERFEPYGEGNRPLVFLSKDVPIVDAQIVGKTEQNHLKLTLDFGKHKWPAMFWKGAERLERDFRSRTGTG